MAGRVGESQVLPQEAQGSCGPRRAPKPSSFSFRHPVHLSTSSPAAHTLCILQQLPSQP